MQTPRKGAGLRWDGLGGGPGWRGGGSGPAVQTRDGGGGREA